MQVGVKSSRRVETHESNRKAFPQNIKIGSQKQLGCPPTPEAPLHGKLFHPKHLVKKKGKQHRAKGVKTLMLSGR
jgi:hypothetical protein